MFRFSLDDVPNTPWKNGAGLTREIAVCPPGSDFDHFEWRVSAATISSSGPFSRFEGVDRIIMLLEGDGMILHGEGSEHRLAVVHQPFEFAGEAALSCTLLGSQSVDFNVMTRRRIGRARVDVFDAARHLPGASEGLVMCLLGQWHCGDVDLVPGEGFWWCDAPMALDLVPQYMPSKLLSVSWHRG